MQKLNENEAYRQQSSLGWNDITMSFPVNPMRVRLSGRVYYTGRKAFRSEQDEWCGVRSQPFRTL